jgi:hypothetical protein
MCLNSYAVSLTLTLLLLPSLNNLSSCWDRQSIRSSSPPTSIPSLTNPWVPSYQQLHSTEASQWHQLRTHLHHSIAIGPVGAATTTDKTSAPHNHFNPHHQPSCYGRSTVVSDLDGVGFVLNVRWRKLARAGLYRSPYNGAMDKHTRGECVSSTEGERKEGTLQSIPAKEDEVQGLYKVCTERMYRGSCRGSTKYTTWTE